MPEYSPRKPFVGLALCAAAGILCADRWAVNPLFVVAALLPSAVLLLWRPVLPGCFLFTAAAFFLFHLVNYQENPSRMLARELGQRSEVVHVEGVVVDEPEPARGFRDSVGARFRLRLETGASLVVRWSGPPPAYGDRVSCAGTLSNIPGPRNPAEFDYAAYMKRLNVYSELDVRYPSDERILGSGQGNPVLALAFKVRRWMQGKLTLDLQDAPDIAGLIQSLVLGLKHETPEQMRELFQRTGTLHLFTVNGLHIAMLASIAWFLLKPAGLGRRRAVLLIIPLLVFYATITGLSSGSIRATIMAAVLLGGELLDRRPLALNSLGAACFAIFGWDTNELFMAGFQFSFGVVLAIILLAGRFQKTLVEWARPDPFLPRVLWGRWRNWSFEAWQPVAKLIAVSLAAWIGSLPFTAEYLHLSSPAAVLVNVAVFPMAWAILLNGILSLLSAPLPGIVGAIFNNSNFFLAKSILVVVNLFARLPGGHFYFELPRWRPPLCEVTVFDLGSGGAIHLRAGGRDWLIDTGNPARYGEIVSPYLRSRGVNRLESLVLTHGSAKDVGAASQVLEDFAPRRVVLSTLTDKWRGRPGFEAKMQSKGETPEAVKRGDVLHLSPEAALRVLYPPPDLVARTAEDKALVLQLEAGGAKVLFLSDSGFATEHWLLDHDQSLKSDILVKGQHATDSSGSLDFIEAVAPAVVVSASAKYPAHASDSWAADVTRRGIRLFQQDQTGAVQIDLRAAGLAVRSFLGNQTFREQIPANRGTMAP